MGTIIEDLDPKEMEKRRRLSVAHERRALVEAMLSMEGSGSHIKSYRPGGFIVNLKNSKMRGPQVGKLPPGFQHTFRKLSPDFSTDPHAPNVSTKMLLKKASSRLVEPLEVQRKAKISK